MNDDEFVSSIFGFGRGKVLFRCLKCGLRQSDKAGAACVACVMEEMRAFMDDAAGPSTFDRARYAKDGTASTGSTSGPSFEEVLRASARRRRQEDVDRERFRRAHAVPPPAAAPTINPDAEMLRRLIYLCHPDKHGNSTASQIATKYLLDLKAKGK